MKAQPKCDLCFQRHARDAAVRIGLSVESTEHLLAEVCRELERIPSDVTPPVRASRIHALVREISGDPDPYRDAKQGATQHALSLYPRLMKCLLEDANDPFETAVRLAIAGNIIDLGVASEYDLEASIARVLDQPFAIDQLERMREALTSAREVLYLADNAGETVLDRLLIEILEWPVTYVVKGGPAVNDATLEDALAAGLDEVCKIIDNGAATLGTLLDLSSPEMRRRFAAADLIISKGMANYESLNGTRAGLFFLLQAKCPVIAGHLKVPERSILVLEDRPG